MYLIPAVIFAAVFSTLLGIVGAPRWAPMMLIVAPLAGLEIGYFVEFFSTKLAADEKTSSLIQLAPIHLLVFLISVTIVLLACSSSYKVGVKIGKRLARL